MKKLMTISVMLSIILATFTAARGDILWGVTSILIPKGGEIFTYDTMTEDFVLKHTHLYAGGIFDVKEFGDIAIRKSGEVYVTYSSDYTNPIRFKTLAKVNTANWSFDWTRTLPVSINAMTFINDILYLQGAEVQGLYKLSILDGSTDPTFVGNSGFLNSNGDLFYNPAWGQLFNVYTPNNIGNLARIDTNTGIAVLVGNLDTTAKFGTTFLGLETGWAGMEFDSLGRIWAGTRTDSRLYIRTDISPGNEVHFKTDLDAFLQGNITGLSVPELEAIGLFDFTRDQIVNFEDFRFLSRDWLVKGYSIADSTNDGIVDAQDLNQFSEQWLEESTIPLP